MNKEDDELKMNYASLRTKLAAMRTLLLFVVSIKAFILLSVKKNFHAGFYAAVVLLAVCGYHYYYIVSKTNKNELIIQSYLFDFYPLLLIPVLLLLTYYNLKYKFI